MDNLRRPSLRDCIVWVVVIGGHVLVLALFSRLGHPSAARIQVDARPGSLLILLEPRQEDPPADELQRQPPGPPGSVAPRARAAPESDTAITLPAGEVRADPSIDWYREGEESARRSADQSAQPGPRAFGEHPVSPYRRCPPPESSFEWNPEPDKAGFAGGLPFVRLGDRCIVGLGFFGCAIGDLPKPNGRLFDDMHDADRRTSSIPEVADCRP